MSIQLKLRRGTTAQHSTFTGASGEVTVDTDKKTLVVHDGVTAGGVPLVPTTDVSTSGGANKILKTDASGNLGLGVTPSAWVSPFKAFQFGPNGGSINYRTDANQAVELALNWYYDGTTSKYISTNWATRYRQFSGAHEWYTAASGTAGNPITFTQAMTLDASGNLLVGTTSSTYSAAGRGVIEVNGGSTAITALKVNGSGVGYTYHDGTAMSLWNSVNGNLLFGTNNTERSRIDSSGQMWTTNGAGAVAKAYDCRAWVNFNGTGTVAIRASGNVSSITDNGVGNYTVNFTTAMPDVNYNYVTSCRNSAGAAIGTAGKTSTTAAQTASALSVESGVTSTNYDFTEICVSIFR